MKRKKAEPQDPSEFDRDTKRGLFTYCPSMARAAGLVAAENTPLLTVPTYKPAKRVGVCHAEACADNINYAHLEELQTTHLRSPSAIAAIGRNLLNYN